MVAVSGTAGGGGGGDDGGGLGGGGMVVEAEAMVVEAVRRPQYLP